MKLTEHFTLEEFERSETARKKRIDNRVPEQYIGRIRDLCDNILEPLRCHAGKPVVINSGYRCPELNKAVGGSPSSQHMKGEAADIRVESYAEGREWFDWIRHNCNFDQLIWETSANGRTHWIHVSYRKASNRRQVRQM